MTYVFGICVVEGCGREGRTARGMCMAHYERWRKYGDPTGGGCLKGEPLAYLNDVVLKHDGDACLIWPFARSGAGYGQVHRDGKNLYVHRIACESRHGPAPEGKPQALHSCGNGHLGCVNPRHLSWGDQSANEADKVHHGTSNRREHRDARRAA